MEDMTIASLGSVAGATAGTLIIMQIVKMFGNVSDSWIRGLCLIIAGVLLLGATIFLGATAAEAAKPSGAEWAGLIVTAVFNGIVAGFGAMKGYETMAHGFANKVSDAPGS